MFEQELYNHEVSAVRLEPGDPFYNYEIKNWDFSPRLYKILAASAIFNLLALFFIVQSDLLTRRGCDSPFVGRVCQVLDTVYVGSLIFGTDREYIDAPYEKTDLGDAEVTFIDVTGVTPPLTYPTGYFQLANPEQELANVTDPMAGSNFLAPGIPANPTISGRNLIDTPAIKLNPNPNPVIGDLPGGSMLGDANNNPTLMGNRKGRRGGKPFSDVTANANTNPADANSNTANPTVDPTQMLSEKDINSRPLTDLADTVNGLRAKGEFNLDAEFSVEAKGKLTKEGRLDKKTFKFTKVASSDPKMIAVVKQSIEAFNDTGMLQYLEQLSGKDLNLAIEQGKDNISGEVRSEMETDSRANLLASILKFGLDKAIEKKQDKIAKFQAENNPDDAQALQNAMDELALLSSTTIVHEGKQLVVKFTSPKEAIHSLIQRKLDAQAKAKKESGAGPVGLNNNTAVNK